MCNSMGKLERLTQEDALDEMINKVCWHTYLVGLKESFQDENTPDDECYWVSVKDLKQIIKNLTDRNEPV